MLICLVKKSTIKIPSAGRTLPPACLHLRQKSYPDRPPQLEPCPSSRERSGANVLDVLGTAEPPFRPASLANSRFTANERFSFGTDRPPLRAISRRASGSIPAKPRFPGISISNCLFRLIPGRTRGSPPLKLDRRCAMCFTHTRQPYRPIKLRKRPCSGSSVALRRSVPRSLSP